MRSSIDGVETRREPVDALVTVTVTDAYGRPQVDRKGRPKRRGAWPSYSSRSGVR